MEDQIYLIITIVLLILIFVFYSQNLLNKTHFIELRLAYYLYWYYLLYADVSKYIIVILTFGYLIITTVYQPTISVDEQSEKVNTYIAGYRRGYSRGIEKCKED